MFELFIYGCSDDLIEVDGDFREEFYAPLTGTSRVVFDDGTIVKVIYEGEWVMFIENEGESLVGEFKYGFEECQAVPVPDYSEVQYLQFESKPTWVGVMIDFKRIK
jgi:hypothetical protein